MLLLLEPGFTKSRNQVSKLGMTPLTVTFSDPLVNFLLPIPYNFGLC